MVRAEMGADKGVHMSQIIKAAAQEFGCSMDRKFGVWRVGGHRDDVGSEFCEPRRKMVQIVIKTETET